ncbi:hypothetical protein ACQPYK_33165 [Streptosporangium sp. CA-135522]|uniref:hypothetical protein n=1 Tax=Streptosporangium sp. CA-135522 TaxID=3240072 RepID=UPI003D90F581
MIDASGTPEESGRTPSPRSLGDAKDPREIVTALAARVPAGSHVFATYFTRIGEDGTRAEAIRTAGTGPERLRTGR